MLDDTNYFEDIFVSNHKFVFLQDCYLTGRNWRPYRFSEDIERPEFFFYNKGIYISDFGGIKCPIPYPLDAIGYINYTGQNVKLDVSRNNVISGRLKLQQELSIILLNYSKEKIVENNELIVLINAMIEFLQRE